MELNIFCDGGARGNPGAAAVGVAAEISNPKFQISNLSELSSSGQLRISKYIGVATNNQAEYRAVVHALQWLLKNLGKLTEQPDKINFYLDSELVVNQLNGNFKVKNAKLRELLFNVRSLENQIQPPVSYYLISRAENRQADRLVNEALNSRCRE